MPIHRVCGLRLKSDFDLHPLPRAGGRAAADVVVRRAEVRADGIENSRLKRALTQVGDGCVWFDVPDIARFQIDHGREISVHPYEDADDRSISLFLLGSALGALLHQRGFLALHANVVKVDDAAVLFAGVSGAGKSTTAAAMLARGFEVLADDVAAIDADGRFAAGIPRLKLWKDALGQMNTSLEGLEQIRPQVDKYHLPMPVPSTSKPLPVRAIYILRSANEMEPARFELEHLKGLNKFRALKVHTYRPHFMEGLGLKPQHLKLCAALAARTPVVRIVRPTVRFNAPELAARVLDDLRGKPEDGAEEEAEAEAGAGAEAGARAGGEG